VNVGDLINFSGEYYVILPDGNVEWILSSEARDGLVIEKVEEVMLVLSKGEYFSVGCDHPTVKIEVVNGDKND